MILYRPVGLKELELIAELDFRAFPPRLEIQPIFYPVLTFEYAEQIARDWNSTREDHAFIGFVTEFDVDDAFVARYAVQTAGGAVVHRELWVPAEELDEFNRHILDKIRVIATYERGARAN